ncbi:MAG: hypothetical protein C0490_03080 [Marivirga sp.]|nr:hypothetical protein [Marivirga sp.]
MSSFIKNLAIFLAILCTVTLIGVLLPTTPRASTSHMFGKLKMDSLLKKTEPPRLILVGGSNLSLTINSQLLKDSLHINPINTAISWNIGFVYMFENTLRYVRPGDIIVASIEYNQFYNGAIYGGPDLTRTILDVAPNDFFKLRWRQYYNMIAHVPLYAFSKFKPGEYFFTRDPLEIYDRNSTNQYGDNCKHWNSASRRIPPESPLPIRYDAYAFDILKDFESRAKEKGVTLLITFPAIQQASFKIQYAGIKSIEREFNKRNFHVMGYPERYIMSDTLIFDTPYHLIKKGVDLRTELLIEDLKIALHFPKPMNVDDTEFKKL